MASKFSSRLLLAVKQNGKKINVKNFFAILTVCITTDCKFYQANEKILSYQLQGQPQKMGYSQIPVKKYADT